MSDSKFRNICVTWNNYPSDYLDKIHALPPRSYFVVGKEVAPETGTPHLQAYIEFISAVSLRRIHKSCPGVHIEKRKGTSIQASVYCKKDDDFIEEGELSKQGKRTDLDSVREILKTSGIREVADTCTSMSSLRFAECYLKLRERERDFKPYVVWLFGEAGTGKTRTAIIDAWRRGFEHDTYIHSGKGQWWEGYDAHHAVIIDDIRSTFCDYGRMLNIIDRYGCRVENKGGSRQMLGKVMYITAPCPPEDLWNTNESKKQLLRRIDTIQEIKYNGSVVHKGNAISTKIPKNWIQETTIPPILEGRGDDCCEEVCETSDAEE